LSYNLVDEAVQLEAKGVKYMCGRFVLRTPTKKLAAAFQVEEVPTVEARYNIAPTQTILAVEQGLDGREAKQLKWGLVPSWAKEQAIGSRLINARSETVAEKPSFREAFKKRRCIIPADGFYEWQRAGGKRLPYFFQMKDERPFGFAGLWERWQGASNESVESCTILTTDANEILMPVHDRMPVILHPDDYELWLDVDERKVDLLKELLQPYPAEEMRAHRVSEEVNSVRNQGDGLIKEVTINSA
jgi:putative SOS response-associated peptidase YedK